MAKSYHSAALPMHAAAIARLDVRRSSGKDPVVGIDILREPPELAPPQPRGRLCRCVDQVADLRQPVDSSDLNDAADACAGNTSTKPWNSRPEGDLDYAPSRPIVVACSTASLRE